MKINWFNSKKYLLIFSIGAFVLLVLTVITLFLFFLQEMKVLKEGEEKWRQDVVFLKDILSKRDKSQKGMSLIESKKSASLIKEMTNLAVYHNIQLLSLEASNVVAGKEAFYKKALFTMTATSSLKDLGLFLEGIKAASWALVNIEGLSLTEDQNHLVKSKIILGVYVGKNYGQR